MKVSKPIPKSLLYVVALAVYPEVGGEASGCLRCLNDLGDLELSRVSRHLQRRLALARHTVQPEAGAADEPHYDVRHPLRDGGQERRPAVRVCAIDVEAVEVEEAACHQSLAVEDGGQERSDPAVVCEVWVDSLPRYQILDKLMVALHSNISIRRVRVGLFSNSQYFTALNPLEY